MLSQEKNLDLVTQIRLDYDINDNLEYVGYANLGVAADEDGWYISKLSYTGDNITLIQRAFGIWDSKSLLFP